jgi:hypothetical protein
VWHTTAVKIRPYEDGEKATWVDYNPQIHKSPFSIDGIPSSILGIKIKRTGYDSFKEEMQTTESVSGYEVLYPDADPVTVPASEPITFKIDQEINYATETMSISVVWTLPGNVEGHGVNLSYEDGPIQVDQSKLVSEDVNVNQVDQ